MENNAIKDMKEFLTAFRGGLKLVKSTLSAIERKHGSELPVELKRLGYSTARGGVSLIVERKWTEREKASRGEDGIYIEVNSQGFIIFGDYQELYMENGVPRRVLFETHHESFESLGKRGVAQKINRGLESCGLDSGRFARSLSGSIIRRLESMLESGKQSAGKKVKKNS